MSGADHTGSSYSIDVWQVATGQEMRRGGGDGTQQAIAPSTKQPEQREAFFDNRPQKLRNDKIPKITRKETER